MYLYGNRASKDGIPPGGTYIRKLWCTGGEKEMLRPDLMMSRTCRQRFSTRKVSKFRIEFSSAVSVQRKQEIYWTSPSLGFSFHKISLTLLNVAELL